MMRLETNRLVLREWTFKDINDLVEGLNNIEVAQWLALIPHPYTIIDAEKWIQYCTKNSNEEKLVEAYHFAIELKSTQKVIGGISVDKINRYHGSAGGGIWINTKYHGLGYGSEAFGKRIEFAFEELKLRRLDNGYFKGNESSYKLQEKFGYKVEGIRRKAFVCMANGEIMDEYLTGLLKEEWVAVN
ncbi:GNAT family N-acetyltransferase [Pedobacter sp. ISL-68]|uniref:GNAT family N-acetyltransferase n=1 Tax=unclassified Pedobacter TaxID=2628915 RepID=UPI001BED15AF|nr:MULTISPECIES: GNAT family protein [unclassified Pedobacter]MBT2564688.1 GNAT family N-acetyltransferase [Pedobacter sp. ISL-64]MBT2592423.1 GNAT family N-acetyltransferase [Pedobacter sp. ISL-68]